MAIVYLLLSLGSQKGSICSVSSAKSLSRLLSPWRRHLDDIPDIHDHPNWSQGCLNRSSLYPFVPRILKSWHMRGLKYKKFIKTTVSLRKTQKVHQDYCLLEEDTWWIFLTFLILVKVIQTTICTLVGFLLNISGKLWSIAWDMPNFRHVAKCPNCVIYFWTIFRLL